ncbi:MAG: hypothetical protein WA734_21085 [Candidatus Acidiferrales bacterium]
MSADCIAEAAVKPASVAFQLNAGSPSDGSPLCAWLNESLVSWDRAVSSKPQFHAS